MVDDIERSRLAELAEAATVQSLFDLADDEMRSSLGLDCRQIGGGIAIRMAAAPGIPYFTRAFALGVVEPLTADILDEAVEFVSAAGGDVIPVQIAPHQETPEVLQLLAERGFERGRTWAKMMRPVGDVPEAKTDLRIERVDDDRALDLGRVEIIGMEMPDFMVPWAARQATASGWAGWGAFDGDQIVACGMLFLHNGVGQLSGAATLPSHRGRGAQLALMKARIEAAAGLGARWITAETGSETPEDPNPSLHNMCRAGLELLYHRRNWLLRRQPPPRGNTAGVTFGP